MTTVDSLLRKPGKGTSKTANGRGPLLISQHFNASQSGGVVDGDRHPFEPNATGAALRSIASDPVADTIESGQLFCVDMDHVTRSLLLVADDWFLGLQIFETAQPQPVHHTANSRQGGLERLGDPAECAALVAQVHGLLQLKRIERPPVREHSRDRTAPATCRPCAD